MITGAVNAYREAVIRVSVHDSKAQPHEIDAVVDTGFTGSLTLPPSVIGSLGLTWRSRGTAILANGSVEECDVYAGTVVWDGQPRNVLVESAETEPLVGMGLMYGFDLRVQILDGGEVTLSRIQ